MTKISFVYFDVGGVAIKDFSDSDKWNQMQVDLGIVPNIKPEYDKLWETYRDQICLDYDVDELIPIMRQHLNLTIPDGYSMLNDFVNRFEKNRSIWPVIKQLSKTKKIGLLTNMYPRMLGEIIKQNLLPPSKWDVIIDSSVVNVQKPDQKIFLLAEQEANVPKNEILFIDNQQKNVDAASKYGWQSYLYDSSNYKQSSLDLAKFLKL